MSFTNESAVLSSEESQKIEVLGEPTPSASPKSDVSTSATGNGQVKRYRLMLFTCDICGDNPLQNVRFHCQTCEDFDLCENCYNQKRHNAHESLPIPITPFDPRLKSLDPATSVPAAASVATSSTLTSNRSRRSVTVTLDPMERMEQILTRNHLRIRTSHYSSNAVQLFLDLYDQSMALFRTTEKVRSKGVDQLILRTALVLVGSLAKRTQSLLRVPLPLEPLHDVEQIFVSQLQRTDPGLNTYLMPFRNSLDEKPILDVEGFLNEVVHLLNAYCADKEKPVCKLGLRAIDEFRDACGLPSGLDQDSTVKETKILSKKKSLDTSVLVLDTSVVEKEATKVSALKTSQEDNEVLLPSTSSRKSKTISRRNSVEEIASSSTDTAVVVVANIEPVPSVSNSETGANEVATNTLENNSAATPFETISDSVAAHESGECDELRKLIVLLKEELQDAHARIDVLAHLLKEKVAMPILRGIDRLGKKYKD